MNKYYWYSYQQDNGRIECEVIAQHPFEHRWERRTRLVNWCEITKEEYELFNKADND